MLYLLRGAVKALCCLQDVLSALQLSRLAVADVAQLLLQRLQLGHFLLLSGAEQGSNLLVQLHINSKPLLYTQRETELAHASHSPQTPKASFCDLLTGKLKTAADSSDCSNHMYLIMMCVFRYTVLALDLLVFLLQSLS